MCKCIYYQKFLLTQPEKEFMNIQCSGRPLDHNNHRFLQGQVSYLPPRQLLFFGISLKYNATILVFSSYSTFLICLLFFNSFKDLGVGSNPDCNSTSITTMLVFSLAPPC